MSTRDPAGRVVAQVRGPDGALEPLVEAERQPNNVGAGRTGARHARGARADGVTATTHTCLPRTGRLSTVTDPKHQVTTYSYVAADALLLVSFVVLSAVYGFDVEYRFEVAAISVDWSVLIVAGMLLAILWRPCQLS